MQPDLSLVFSSHSRELRTYLQRRLGDGHTASDLMQDTFLNVLERPETCIQDIRAYLYAIARNLLVNHHKQERRRRTQTLAPEAFAQMVDDRPSPEEIVDSRLQLERLHGLVREMPVRTQEIFVLSRIEGLTQIEVARRLGISESSVQKHLAVAIAHMTRRLRGR
ncbi:MULTISPECIES: RNA polymerase sigma factor [Ancylobacter]|uniref:RNA polymerase sigma-70 factor (ECF subfamily) n=2 Tax=Ancylobacter TaxID=99 RepID=A0A839Z7W8_9HYPH|nr:MULTISPECIES: RNA polymerase sigma factor [Ancylobacter]MBB3771273.1 RNA polymerase sigma-70 factor (ECF subfamily) [Ancylobacter tetraedralis]MDQ0509138.1 RNA polymerase sigma-70 factor (ECF subfamily) [Ancylobacter amanitiformis]